MPENQSYKKNNLRIVDIARLANVSAGTVDRVIHKRGRVAQDKLQRIEQIMKEVDYEPNMVARALASRKHYQFAAIVPMFSQGDYWELVCKGIDRAAEELRKFNASITYFYFNQHNKSSFLQAVAALRSTYFDGVVITAHFGDLVAQLSHELDGTQTPYIYIDADIAGQNDLAYFGGNARTAGSIAAKLMLKETGRKANIFLAHIRFKHSELSLQMKAREIGFLRMLKESNFKGQVFVVEIDTDNPAPSVAQIRAIIASNPEKYTGAMVLNSRMYELVSITEKLLPKESKKLKMFGFEAIEKNIVALKNGQIVCLLSQRPEVQGFSAMKALGDYVLFGHKPAKINYMPIDILIKENVEYYNN